MRLMYCDACRVAIAVNTLWNKITVDNYPYDLCGSCGAKLTGILKTGAWKAPEKAGEKKSV